MGRDISVKATMEGDQGVEVVVNPTPANDETPAVVDQTDVKVEEPKAKEEAETVPSMGDQGVEEDASSTPANDEAPAVVCQAEDIKGEEPKAEAKEEGDAPKSVPSNDENNVEATEEAVAPSKEVEENKEQTEANEDSKEENKDEKAKSPSPRKDAKRFPSFFVSLTCHIGHEAGRGAPVSPVALPAVNVPDLEVSCVMMHVIFVVVLLLSFFLSFYFMILIMLGLLRVFYY